MSRDTRTLIAHLRGDAANLRRVWGSPKRGEMEPYEAEIIRNIEAAADELERLLGLSRSDIPRREPTEGGHAA
jgi:hypothetical protein